METRIDVGTGVLTVFFTTKISWMHTDNQILLLMSAIEDNNSRSRVYFIIWEVPAL